MLVSVGVTVVKPIVYGNIAKHFGKKREEDGHTHQWTVIVKPYNNEDMSSFVKKVIFKLHESYTNPNRVVTKPPYEVTETGWGEFEVVIKIHFQDPNERPVTIYYPLKLFHTESTAVLGKKHLVNEVYDELVFHEPSAMMHQCLTNTKHLSLAVYKHEIDFEEKKKATLVKINTAKTKVRSEITDLSNRLKESREMIQKMQQEVRVLESTSNQSAGS
ncbi:Gas41 [Bugula neritina]|uniref:YEATS domain-containing protein 4 n=1 Tax=Bugula neritina TaxID=10212 RepID=A0A7J7KG66_BUGNE|nr:Gas41 [Bugula neritina]